MASRCAAGAARRSCGSPSREGPRRILLSSEAARDFFTDPQCFVPGCGLIRLAGTGMPASSRTSPVVRPSASSWKDTSTPSFATKKRVGLCACRRAPGELGPWKWSASPRRWTTKMMLARPRGGRRSDRGARGRAGSPAGLPAATAGPRARTPHAQGDRDALAKGLVEALPLAASERQAEQPDAEVGVLPVNTDVVKELVTGEELVELPPPPGRHDRGRRSDPQDEQPLAPHEIGGLSATRRTPRHRAAGSCPGQRSGSSAISRERIRSLAAARRARRGARTSRGGPDGSPPG